MSSLEKNSTDKLVAIASGMAGGIPFVGGVIGSILTDNIPRLRQERIVAYIRELEQRLSKLEDGVVGQIIESPEKMDFIETGGFQAARAMSSERIQDIATVIISGLIVQDVDFVRKKRLLGLLGEIDNDEVLLLKAYGASYGGGDQEGWNRIQRPNAAHLGSSIAEIDDDKLFELGKQRLLRFGLLQKNFSFIKKGEYPEFDKSSGGFKGRIEISYLGRMLLRDLEVPCSIDK